LREGRGGPVDREDLGRGTIGLAMIGCHHAQAASALVHRNVEPSIHMRCRITASLRATVFTVVADDAADVTGLREAGHEPRASEAGFNITSTMKSEMATFTFCRAGRERELGRPCGRAGPAHGQSLGCCQGQAPYTALARPPPLARLAQME